MTPSITSRVNARKLTSSSSRNSMEVTSSSTPKPTEPTSSPLPDHRDFLLHLDSFLSRRDGVDKLLKISRYAAKLIISTSPTSSETLTLTLIPRLRSFESSVGLSRKAFRLGKFVQDLNSLRSAINGPDLPLSILAYGGEGIYYFLEQILWLSKTGLIPLKSSSLLSKISECAELIGYIGSISLKLRELERMRARPDPKDETERRKLEEKIKLKRLSVVQDVADGLMAYADVRDGKGRLTGPALMASAGLLSALISAKKNWDSC